MYSEKLTSIPKEQSQALKTYLAEIHSKEDGTIRRPVVARKTGLDEPTVQTILSDLTSEDVLRAKINVRCPHCTTQHGKYARKGEIPSGSQICFQCENEFQTDHERNWEVIYEFSERGVEFLPGNDIPIKLFVESKTQLPSQFFEKELTRFREMDNPQKRGREFDKFIGLLFQQIDQVDVRLKKVGNSGEVDVHLLCLGGPDWLRDIVGTHTLIENKWEQDPIQKSDINQFHAKAADIANCQMAYFVSMSGFSRGHGKNTGALAKLRHKQHPKLVDFWEDDVEKMVKEGSPEKLLRNRLLK